MHASNKDFRLNLTDLYRFVAERPLYDHDEDIVTAESLQYSFENIRVATDDFDEANKLGQGGFGPVYKVREIIKRGHLFPFFVDLNNFEVFGDI